MRELSLDKTDMEPTALAFKGDIQEVIDVKPMPGTLVEKEVLVDKQRMVVSKLDPPTAMDDGIILAKKYDKEGKALEY